MAVLVGDWWTMDKRGRTEAHRVGAVLPDLLNTSDTNLPSYDHSSWIPLCACAPGLTKPRTESASLFSTFIAAQAEHPRCSACEVMSPALDRWLAQRPTH
ncbi:Uncharacterised protein [Mycobacteroides abscessus subsp. abscessus]|uniref:hypothetical protein n=1 Tax=Mycobacteroides abscessus TaxID=36809 RepID=UPI00092960A7|nr:hypothetical protein [Mycobacteroides abscessus]SHU68697.1 Uncharacterised protein [Mycobacteroides abscessus subsp. abscessus]